MPTAPPLIPESRELLSLDFTRLTRQAQDSFLKGVQDRAEARLVPFTPISPEERLTAFKRINYRPHGIYLPDNEELRHQAVQHVREIGFLDPFPGDDPRNAEARLQAYHAYQDETEAWQRDGITGVWTGQQGVARSPARFRIVAWGRRGGKTTHAAREAVGVAVMRPRSWVWLAAPTMKLVSRAFDMVIELVEDLGLQTRSIRNTVQEKLIILDNGARLEGMSLENIFSAAGAAIDFAVIDEAAQVVPEAWYRAILPPLTDRNGQALLISSWEGEGDFFHTKALEAQADMAAHGAQAAWELFQDASYDVNFYAFPQGRKSPALVQAEKEMPPLDFLEQFGAIPAGARERVFPEFKEKIHTARCPYDPDKPVILVCDPSGGANAYAVIVLQEHGDLTVQIDEFYEQHMSTEEIAPVLASREWFDGRLLTKPGESPRWEIDNITDMIVDSASPEEIRRWEKMGFPAYAVPEKPEIPTRLPLLANQLRDPVRFRQFYRKRVNEVLEGMGLLPDSDYDLTVEQQRSLIIQVEESLSDAHLSGDALRWLITCAHIRIDRSCVNTIQEFKSYSYPKRRRLNMNYSEKPRAWMDHTMDAWGYYIWTRRRFAGEQAPEGFNYLQQLVDAVELEDEPRTVEPEDPNELRQGKNPYAVGPVAATSQDRGRMFIAEMRERGNPFAPRSYLERAF